jgi:D-glutamate cyclase
MLGSVDEGLSMPEIIGENVDRLCTVEMRPQGMPRGKIHRLYEAARRKQNGRPLTLLAAEKLRAAVKPGDYVILATGAGVPPWMPAGETDGPVGIAALGRALLLGLGARPIFVTESHSLRALRAPVIAAGMSVVSPEIAAARTGAAVVMEFSKDDREAQAQATHMVEQFRPAAIIASEKLAPNAKGEIHSVRGTNMTADHAKIHHLFELAGKSGIPTIGIADGGNEVGCGLIYDDTRTIMEYGARCQCPCGDGMATTVRTDVLVLAAVSNFGAYGICATLGYLLGNPDLVHDPDTHYRLLEANVREGASDGMSGRPLMKEDGISVAVCQGLVRQLHELVATGLQTVNRPF